MTLTSCPSKLVSGGLQPRIRRRGQRARRRCKSRTADDRRKGSKRGQIQRWRRHESANLPRPRTHTRPKREMWPTGPPSNLPSWRRWLARLSRNLPPGDSASPRRTSFKDLPPSSARPLSPADNTFVFAHQTRLLQIDRSLGLTHPRYSLQAPSTLFQYVL